MSTPIVSVIIPVYNVMPWLTECVQSALDQSLGPEAVEIIAVDDASTDGGGAELERLAAEHENLRVIHLPVNSGGAGQPCNVGVEHAKGDYLFFLGADDYLGPEALERMVDMARKAGSDIVLGKTTSVPGFGNRGHNRIWTRNQPNVDLFSSRIYDSLGQIKLFRRKFFIQLNRPFEVGRKLASDQPVVAYAYLHAKVISVVADYDCYFIRDRGDGTNATSKPEDPVEFIAHIDSVARMVAEHVRAGDDRDHLMERHVRNEVLRWALGRCWFDEMPDRERDALVTAVLGFLDRWMTPGVFDRLPPIYRLMAHCMRTGDWNGLSRTIQYQQEAQPRRAIVEDGRVYADLPLFRDPESGVPDAYYELTQRLPVKHRLNRADWDGNRLRLSGYAFISHVDTTDQRVSIVLRERNIGYEYRIPTHSHDTSPLSDEFNDGLYDYSQAGFDVEIDLAQIDPAAPEATSWLADGKWDVLVEVNASGVVRQRRLGSSHDETLREAPQYRVLDLPGRIPAVVRTYFTKFGNLTVDVAARPQPDPELARLARMERSGRNAHLTVASALTGWPSGMRVRLCLMRRGVIRSIDPRVEHTDGGLEVDGRISVPRWSWQAGRWAVVLRLSWPDGRCDLPVSTPKGKLSMLFGRMSLRDAAKRVLRRVKRAFSVPAPKVEPPLPDILAGPHRGRIVMLVDNTVTNDSRVQKEARSAAEAGWRVTLVGRSPDKLAHSWWIGDAHVKLVHMKSPLRLRPAQFRKDWLHHPLAYPMGRTCAWRVQKVKARRAELDDQLSGLRMSGGAKPSVLNRARIGVWRVKSAGAKAMRRWVVMREKATKTAATTAKQPNRRSQRMYAKLWGTAGGRFAWRRLDPALWDYELAFGPVIDRLQPDIIHANDFRMLGVGARAMRRARAAGRQTRLVWDAHEYLPGIKPWRDDPRWLPAMMSHEAEYARSADSVITVSEELAKRLKRRHNLAKQPTVVLNAPDVDAELPDMELPRLRESCGLEDDVPLMVYSGTAAPQRGLGIMVAALPSLPGVHVAMVVNRPGGPYMTSLIAAATELGVADRVHVLPYVPYQYIPRFLSEADIGVIPIHHWPNHELALITKYFEYAHAHLPLIVSDVRTMAQMTQQTGIGEVFKAEDLGDYVRVAKTVLADPKRYRAAYTAGMLAEWTWHRQAEILDEVYQRLMPARAEITSHPHRTVPLLNRSWKRSDWEYRPAEETTREGT
ncbi:glycosyltransferase [Stackebrandtia endophytica]|uniref:glycosyltransferase n=1 Tax=Stackebrandtia endophytica TaxID=1496996 RepID=UPI00147769E2|nr:glycosyltransferase [Stackebrandtia endophytica]